MVFFVTFFATYFRDYPVVINNFFLVFLHMIHDFMECEQLSRHFFFLPIVIEKLKNKLYSKKCTLISVIIIK